MIASCIAGNGSRNRRKFANILHKAAPYVFIPFFTLTGASLKLDALVKGIVFAAFLSTIRFLSIAAGTFVAGKYILRQQKEQYGLLFMTLIPQAGTLIGLVNQLATFGDWAADLSSAVIASLLINYLIGLRML